MNRLNLCISQEGYSVQFFESVVSEELAGGFDRYVGTTNAKKRLVSCSFVCNESNYEYLRSFYLNWQLDPQPFLVKLIVEKAGLDDYLAQFVSDSFRLNSVEGRFIKCSAQFVVVIDKRDSIASSKLYPIELESESLQASLTIGDFVLSSSLLNYSTEIESLHASLTVHDFLLNDVLSNYSAEIESLHASLSVHDMQLDDIYIEQDTAIESLQASLTVHDFIIQEMPTFVVDVESIQASLVMHDMLIEFTDDFSEPLNLTIEII